MKITKKKMKLGQYNDLKIFSIGCFAQKELNIAVELDHEDNGYLHIRVTPDEAKQIIKTWLSYIDLYKL